MRHKKGKLNPELLKEELKKYKLMSEYSFYVGEEDKDDKDLILGEEGDEEDTTDEFGGDSEGGDAEGGFGDEPIDNAEGGFGDEPMDDEPMDNTEGGFGDEPIDDMGGEPMPMGDEEMPTDEVELDVTELVQGNEEARAESEEANAKLDVLIKHLGDLESKIANMDKISSKIDDLERQVEKRNPTPDEKLQMRSFDSYPYNLKLTDYWAEKEGKYDVSGEEAEKEYVLKQSDIDNEYNNLDIRKSFGEEEDDGDEIKRNFNQ